MKKFLKNISKLMGYLFNKMVEKSTERLLKYYNILENKPERRWEVVLKNAKVKEWGKTNTKRKRRKRDEKKFMDVDCIDADLFGDHTFICR